MAWTSPTLGTTGDLYTAAVYNRDVVNNLLYLYGELTPTEFNAGNSGTALTVNFTTNGPAQKATRTGNCTFTLAAPRLGTYILKLIANGSAFTVAFSPSVKWDHSVVPSWSSTNGAIDLITLYYDGTSWYGAAGVAMA